MMNRRIRSIFWLMTVCIVAINAFQAYWLWTTYGLNREQFGNAVQDALFQVVEEHQVDNARKIFRKDVPGTPPLPGDRILIRREGVSNGGSRFYYRYNNDSVALAQADTLANRISRAVVQEWADGERVDLRKIYAAYSEELTHRGIEAAFLIDTLHILPAPGSGNVIVFNGLKQDQEGRFKTVPLPVNPLRHLFVQATFETPVPYLLKRMGWLLACSLLLLLLTTGCFVFMLRTILRQKRLSEIKNDFINNMTHELKTPIATVTAAVEALQHFGALKDPRKTDEYLQISHNNLQRLSDLVEKVLNLAVEERQELEFHVEPVGLAEMVGDLIASHKVQSAKPIAFHTQIPEHTTVQVDRMHFGNVLNNLIDNAIKYSHERVSISFDFREIREGWQLSVIDDGIGIPKAYQAAVFDRFFRVPTGDLHQVKGFGLGLAYVRQVVERHGGSVSLASEPGKGSTFTLKF